MIINPSEDDPTTMTFADGTRLSFSFSPAPWFTPQTAVLSCWWWRIHHLHRTGLERKLQKWHFIRLGSRLVLESKVRLKVLKIFKERRINVDAKNVRPCSLPNCVNSFYWSGTGSLVAITSEDSFYILRFDRDAYNAKVDEGAEVTDEGFEEAFEVVADVSDSEFFPSTIPYTLAKWIWVSNLGRRLLYLYHCLKSAFATLSVLSYSISPFDMWAFLNNFF